MNKGASRSNLIKVGVCFFLSGTAALLYQTAWMRQLSVVFGTSELAVATVLTAYMSGLSLGAVIAARFISKITRPLLVYGLLEGGIAVTAILVPYLLLLGGHAAVFFLGGQDAPPEASGFGQLLFYFISTLLVLVIPTALMGATLPLLSKYVVETDEQVGSRIGGLYALNTIGAVAGTLFAAFFLLPYISLTHTILIGAAMNLAVLVVVINIVKSNKQIDFENTPSTDQSNLAGKTSVSKDPSGKSVPFWRTDFGWILPVMTLSGVATFTYEVLWTRLIGHVLGGSVPAFAVMLAGFLTGIAAGSAIATKFSKTHESAKTWFIVSQIGIASLSAFTYYMINFTAPEAGGLLSNSIFAFSLLLPSTLFIGATFPLAVRMFASNEHDAPAASARVYAWNTVGAIFGATFAGYFLIPSIKYAGAVQFAVYLNLILACVTVFIGSDLQNKNIWLRRATPFVLLLLSVAFYRPEWPDKIINFSLLMKSNVVSNDIAYYEVGRSSTVVLIDDKNFFNIRNNGLPEASIRSKGVPLDSVNTQILLSVLPVVARPDSETMLVAGFGGGVVVEKLPPSLKNIDVLELEPKVIEANKSVSDRRLHDPFKDPRINIINNDARSALQLTNKKYDVIVSQPSHPWTAGASHLYTEQYMKLAEDHLTERGVFLQWMNVGFTDEYLLRSLTATLVSTFKHVRVYQFAPTTLFFLASNSPLEIEQDIIKTGRPFSNHPAYYRSIGFSSVESVLSGLIFDNAAVRDFSKLGKIITDDFNAFGTRSALAMDAENVIGYSRLVELILEHGSLFADDSWIYSDSSGINHVALVDKIALTGTPAFVRRTQETLSSLNSSAFVQLKSRNLYNNSLKTEAKAQLRRELDKYPSNQDLKYQLLTYYRDDLESKNLANDLTLQLKSLGELPRRILENLENLDQSGGDYEPLQNMDELLASAKEADGWYLPAQKMRVFWRAQLAKDNNDPKLAKEALELANTLLITSADQWTHEVRVVAAYISGDSEALAFSMEKIVTPLKLTLKSYDNPILMIPENDKVIVIEKLDRLLDLYSSDSPINIKTIKETRKELTELKAMYSNLNAARG